MNKIYNIILDNLDVRTGAVACFASATLVTYLISLCF